jgi:hypothetical protein
MPYGYTGALPNQIKNNSGVFSVADITDLTAKGQAGGSLELIQDQTVSSVGHIDFTSIKENKFDVHILFLNNITSTANLNGGYQFFESGVLRTASDYDYAQYYGTRLGSFSGQSSTGETRIVSANFFSANPTSGIAYFYDLGDSSKFSYCTYQNWVDGQYLFQFGSGVSPLTSLVDGIRVYTSGTAISGNARLYGVKKV